MTEPFIFLRATASSEGGRRMSALALRAATRPVDWAGLAILLLLTLAIGGYAVFIVGPRVRLAVRAGWAGVRADWGPLVGLACGIAGFALVVLDLATGWLALAQGMRINSHAHQWTALPIIVCGFIMTWTEPGKPRSLLDSTIAAKARAHPRQALAGFLVGAATWGLFPLRVALAAALPIPLLSVPLLSIPLLFVWPALLLAEIAFGIWWWSHHGRIEELTDGQRTVYLPSFVTHPVVWGWICGTVGTLLLWPTLAQMRTSL